MKGHGGPLGRGSGGGGRRKRTVLFASLAAAAILVAALIGVLTKSDDHSGEGKNVRKPVPLTGSTTTSTTPTAPTPLAKQGEKLEVVNTVVKNAPPPDDPVDRVPGAAVELQLRNTGDEVSVLTKARFVIRRFTAMPAKSCGLAFSLQPISERYHVRLPLDVSPGMTVDEDLHQVIKPNRADRIRFELGIDDPDHRVIVSPSGTGASRIYQLGVEILHDGRPQPVEADPIVIALPWPSADLTVPLDRPGETLPAAVRSKNETCTSSNVDLLREAVRAGGTASPELEEFLNDPKAATCRRGGARVRDFCGSTDN